MHSSNKCNGIEYGALFIGVYFIITNLYMKYIFRVIPTFEYTESKIVFLVMIGFGSYVGYLKTSDNNRNLLAAFCSIAIPEGLYSVAAYFNMYPVMIVSIILVMVIISLYVMNKSRSEYNNRQRYKKAIVVMNKALLSVTCILLVVTISVRNTLSSGELFSIGDEPSSTTTESKDYKSESALSFLYQFDECNWEKIPKEERATAMIDLARIEKNYLGITQEIKIEFVNLESKNLAGSTNAQDGVIRLDEGYLSRYTNRYNAHEAMDTVCHEMRHIYQHEIINLYKKVDETDQKLLIFRSADKYIDEFNNYIPSNEDGTKYSNQLVEEDSRAYADTRKNYYYNLMEKELGNETKNN